MKNKIGIDICAISRIKIDEENLLKRFLHTKELEYLNSLENKKVKMEFAAGRWAAKEAMYKAYNFKDSFHSILIESNHKQPKVVEPKNLTEFEISISHDDNFAIAVAVWEIENMGE
jgi:holo-[acyl-carrier protein] synthase